MDDLRASAPTKQRLIGVAVDAFGRDGFGVGIRTIASRATAAAGTVQYHFGGKDGLRDACDRHVLTIIDKALPVSFLPEGVVREQAAEDGAFEGVLCYCMRSLAEGTPLARQLVSRLTSHVYGLLGASTEDGHERREQASQVVRFGLGAMVLDFAMRQPVGSDDSVRFVKSAWETEFVPHFAHDKRGPDDHAVI
ncbi:TetR/AcrR family transcriptional regulator [Ruania alkalisoli]|uniref:TetR/AcrR family transcriptional regulator n=1 Tax=Ruania alkalisoli TaxID=2779775 RepID=UPI001FE461E0|nr:TetR family transcriptional regulator [Ruania alkalisoli]